MPQDSNYSISTLFAFIDSDFDESAAHTLHETVNGLAQARNWVLDPPAFIDAEDDGVRTVGAVLDIYSAYDQHGNPLPIEIDQDILAQIKTFINSLQQVSQEHGIDIGFEMDEDGIGWIYEGRIDQSLEIGLLRAWEETLEQRRNESGEAR